VHILCVKCHLVRTFVHLTCTLCCVLCVCGLRCGHLKINSKISISIAVIYVNLAVGWCCFTRDTCVGNLLWKLKLYFEICSCVVLVADACVWLCLLVC